MNWDLMIQLTLLGMVVAGLICLVVAVVLDRRNQAGREQS